MAVRYKMVHIHMIWAQGAELSVRIYQQGSILLELMLEEGEWGGAGFVLLRH